MSPAAVEIEAPAKVNLRLRVLARESTGFHSLESVFCAISLVDTVRVERAAEGVSLTVEGAVDTGPAEENLAVRSARRFLQEVGGGEGGVRIELRKRIPAAAGLGGGSSDAAATLRALNRLFFDPLSDETLLQLGIELGSDVPFFLCGSSLALGWSRGERLLALPPLPPIDVLVAHPGDPMPTQGAFRRIAEARGGDYRPRSFRLRLDDLSTWDGVAAIAANDFGLVAGEALPRLGGAISALREEGALISLLAGSGASVFGIFTEAEPLLRAEGILRAMGFATWRCHTLEAMPDPRRSPAGTA